MESTTQTQTRRPTETAVAYGYHRDRFLAGALLFVFGLVALMGIITAEAFYPGYNAGVQEISDLGATRPPDSIILQPSATIFNTTMTLSGLLVLGATYFVRRAFRDRAVTVALGALGIGILGVGIFDGSEAPMHGIAALLTFFAGGVSAVVAYRVIETPFKYLSVAIGGFVLLLLGSLIALGLLGVTHPLMFLGAGGVERYVAYPVLLWTLGFGGYLMAPVAEPDAV
ncbi:MULTISPECIES: DUF998 domain-containing protein [Haloferax]|uniref:DUF998 domain-containing protein n=1 Tax=Haloferax marinum TaxID=2666143 RepID=A0A6A8G6P7_9EURY|nr:MULTISPECIES: DUF998 domain-containing protein [Haloferax]KAB1196925.1 DUF998 domain-containing protein [Haloferax sp. CBA1150]MRW95943.1 DUF998 domain-containing protein [Haloferax marinum]